MKTNNSITIPYITGDGIGQDIMPAAQKVMEAVRKKTYGKQAKIEFKKLLAGQEAFLKTGNGLPQETLDELKRNPLGLRAKGPTATLDDRSINVALRTIEDLYANVRTSLYTDGVPSPLLAPWGINTVLFRENIEDVYSDPGFFANHANTKELINILNTQYGYSLNTIDTAIGIKPISKYNSERLIRAAAEYAKKYNYKSLTLVHKGNIQKATEKYFKQIGFDLINNEYGDDFITQKQEWILKNHVAGKTLEENALAIDRDRFPILNEQQKENAINEVKETIEKYASTNRKDKKVLSDIIADNSFQQAILNPQNYGVIATTNLNGDYLSDELAGTVGGLGFGGGANHNPDTMRTMIEAVHGTGPDLERNVANPISMIESFAIGFTLHGYDEIAYRLRKGYQDQILTRRVTKDLYNTAYKNYKKVYDQKELAPDTLGIDLLLQYTELVKDSYTVLGTQQFAEEIAQKITDQY